MWSRTVRCVLQNALLLPALVVVLATAAKGQAPACHPSATPPTPASIAFTEGQTSEAEALYAEDLKAHPGDPSATAGLIRSLLRQGRLSQAADVADQQHASESNSAAVLTALGDLDLRKGLPWEARQVLSTAISNDPCFGRAFLLRSRIDRIDSMYASERNDIQRAHELDPLDGDIKHAWNTIDTPAKDITETVEYLTSNGKIDPADRKTAEENVASMLPLLSETSQNCRILPTDTAAALPLQPMMRDGRHVDGYRLDVQLGQSRAKLVVDTAASGLYISRALATQAGLQPAVGDPPGTVRAPSVTVGPLQFRDCLVGVNNTPFPDKGDGFIGTDLFSASLITLDLPHSRLVLQPLPKEPGPLPMDRSSALSAAPELQGWEPVYHKAQYLLVPVALNNRQRHLFLLDTGMRVSTVAQPVADLASKGNKSATSPLQTTSGATIQVYRNAFDLHFANLEQHGEHMVALDSSSTEQKLGMQLGGLLGFDLLHAMVIHLDYRDGLAKFEPAGAEQASPAPVGLQNVANGSPAPADQSTCPSLDATSVTAGSTVEARVTGLWESNHLKPGQKIYATASTPWNSPVCFIPKGGMLYGHVTAATSGKSGTGQLGLQFDHADCLGKGTKELGFKVVSIQAPPDETKKLHSSLPITIGGGTGRRIGDAVDAIAPASYDPNVSGAAAPARIDVGSVLGLPKLTLDVSGGPGCSALMKSPEPDIRLGIGTAFLLVVTQVGP